MESEQIKKLDNNNELKPKTKKYNKFNEDIIILNESFELENNNDNQEIDKKPIYVLTVELERGKLEKIKIFSDSIPYDLANSFCNQHDLDNSAFLYLKEKIEYLLEEYKNNKDINIKKYMDDINNDLKQKNKEFEIEGENDDKTDKNDYFNMYLDENNKSNINKSNLSKNYDINDITVKNNKDKEENNGNQIFNINRNNTDKKFFNNIYKTNIPNRRSQSYKKSANKYNNQINYNTNYFFNKSNNCVNEKNSKINNYYKYYTSKSLNNIKIPNQKKIYSSTPKNIKNNTNTKRNKINNDEESIINKVFEQNEKGRISRKKSSYFRSILSKNESFCKNITNNDTYSSSKINTDTFITNHTSSRILLEGIKFNKENPVIINNTKINNYGQYLFERNKITSQEKQNQIYEIQRQEDIDEFKRCSFMPKTNTHKYSNIHSKYRLQQNKLILNEQKYNFKPKINNNYKTDLTFEQRQKIYTNLYKQRNEELRKCFTNSKYDEKGNELFKPKLISSQYHSNKETISIFDKNYSYYKKYDFNKKELYKKFYKENDKSSNKICSKEKTDKLLNDLYVKTFTRLFKDLDSDQDNLITSFNINTNYVPKPILKIIKPILKELKDDNQTLNCEEFILVMIRFFEDISFIERQRVINLYKNKERTNHDKDFSFNRPQTPSYCKLNKFDCNNSFLNNSNHLVRNNSSKSILFYNKNKNNEKMALIHERKMYENYLNNLNIEDSNDGSFDNYNNINKKRNSHIINQDDINGGLKYFSKITFNNYLKQVKF